MASLLKTSSTGGGAASHNSKRREQYHNQHKLQQMYLSQSSSGVQSSGQNILKSSQSAIGLQAVSPKVFTRPKNSQGDNSLIDQGSRLNKKETPGTKTNNLGISLVPTLNLSKLGEAQLPSSTTAAHSTLHMRDLLNFGSNPKSGQIPANNTARNPNYGGPTVSRHQAHPPGHKTTNSMHKTNLPASNHMI